MWDDDALSDDVFDIDPKNPGNDDLAKTLFLKLDVGTGELTQDINDLTGIGVHTADGSGDDSGQPPGDSAHPFDAALRFGIGAEE